MNLAQRIADQASGHGLERYHAKPTPITGYLSPFGQALYSVGLFRHRSIIELFNGRCSMSAVKHWRKGRRRAPAWAWEAVDCELAKIGAAAAHHRALYAQKKTAGD